MWLKVEGFIALALASLMLRLSPSRWDRLLRAVPRYGRTLDRSQEPSVLVDAVDAASTIYPSGVWCLQRSFAIVMLCRWRGITARAVLGTRPRPFMAHAWVEHGSAVLGDDGERIGRWYTPVERFG